MEEEMNPPGESEVQNQQAATSDTNAPERDIKRKKVHDDHHVGRKYRLFSNYSSYGDSPHTHTSF
jgi:hypothetical protein